MEFFYNLDFAKAEENETIMLSNKDYEVNFKNPKIIKRLNRLKEEKARNIFENAHFNYEMFDYALKEYFRIKNE